MTQEKQVSKENIREERRKNTLAKIDDNSVPCLDGLMMMSRGGGTSCREYRFRLVSCVASGWCAINPKEVQGGLARSTLPSFDMVRGTTSSTVRLMRLCERCVLWCEACVPSESAESSVHSA